MTDTDMLTPLCRSYHNRHCQSETGVESAEWLYEKVKEITKNSSGITVEQVEHSRFPQKSIIARYPGSKDTIGTYTAIMPFKAFFSLSTC